METLLLAGSAVKTQVTLLIATEYFLGRDAFSRKMAGQEAVFSLFRPQEVVSMWPVASGDDTGRLTKLLLEISLNRSGAVLARIEQLAAKK